MQTEILTQIHTRTISLSQQNNLENTCRWFGDFVFSKSCENFIVCWKPGQLGEGEERKENVNKTTVIHKMEVKDCEIWFIRFSADREDKVLYCAVPAALNTQLTHDTAGACSGQHQGKDLHLGPHCKISQPLPYPCVSS